MLRCISIFFISLLSVAVIGQMASNVAYVKSEANPLPRVFLMGEYERPYERMSAQYDQLLIQAFDKDLDKAYTFWTQVLGDMESYADRQQFDLKGLKLWMNVFFNNNGTIQHIAFYPKPNSRNMPIAAINNFLIGFCNQYEFKGNMPKKCSHFGSASFPTFLNLN